MTSTAKYQQQRLKEIQSQNYIKAQKNQTISKQRQLASQSRLNDNLTACLIRKPATLQSKSAAHTTIPSAAQTSPIAARLNNTSSKQKIAASINQMQECIDQIPSRLLPKVFSDKVKEFDKKLKKKKLNEYDSSDLRKYVVARPSTDETGELLGRNIPLKTVKDSKSIKRKKFMDPYDIIGRRKQQSSKYIDYTFAVEENLGKKNVEEYRAKFQL